MDVVLASEDIGASEVQSSCPTSRSFLAMLPHLLIWHFSSTFSDTYQPIPVVRIVYVATRAGSRIQQRLSPYPRSSCNRFDYASAPPLLLANDMVCLASPPASPSPRMSIPAETPYLPTYLTPMCSIGTARESVIKHDRICSPSSHRSRRNVVEYVTGTTQTTRRISATL